MKNASPYVFIKNCKVELNYYNQILDGEIKNVQLADEIEMFKGHERKILHAELHIGNTVIHFSEVFDDVNV